MPSASVSARGTGTGLPLRRSLEAVAATLHHRAGRRDALGCLAAVLRRLVHPVQAASSPEGRSVVRRGRCFVVLAIGPVLARVDPSGSVVARPRRGRPVQVA
ncbi:MAG TPA: hypothetical protein VFR13_01405, partial [Jiangellaceae bacterium]|nr:hypothetical protein [Jiangellaceae bacterium]